MRRWAVFALVALCGWSAAASGDEPRQEPVILFDALTQAFTAVPRFAPFGKPVTLRVAHINTARQTYVLTLDTKDISTPPGELPAELAGFPAYPVLTPGQVAPPPGVAASVVGMVPEDLLDRFQKMRLETESFVGFLDAEPPVVEYARLDETLLSEVIGQSTNVTIRWALAGRVKEYFAGLQSAGNPAFPFTPPAGLTPELRARIDERQGKPDAEEDLPAESTDFQALQELGAAIPGPALDAIRVLNERAARVQQAQMAWQKAYSQYILDLATRPATVAPDRVKEVLDRLTFLGGQVAAARNGVMEGQAAVDGLEKSATEAQIKVDELQGEVDAVEAQIKDATAEIAAETNGYRKRQIELDLEVSRRDLAKKKAALREAKAKLDEAKIPLTARRNVLNAAQQRLDALTKDLEGARKALGDATAESRTAVDQLNTTVGALAALVESLRKPREESLTGIQRKLEDARNLYSIFVDPGRAPAALEKRLPKATGEVVAAAIQVEAKPLPPIKTAAASVGGKDAGGDAGKGGSGKGGKEEKGAREYVQSIPVVHRWVTAMSPGLVATSLGNRTYVTQSEKVNGQDVSIVREGPGSSLDLGAGLIVSYYRTSIGSVCFGPAVGFTKGDATRYLAGLSIIVGRQRDLILTPGIAIGKVTQLAGDQLGQVTTAAEPRTESVTDVGWFIGLTYQLKFKLKLPGKK